MGAVLQTGGLLEDLSVRETVAMVAGSHRRHIGVPAALERAGLTGLAGRRVKKCSGGERQRLRFALALLTDPELLILDEPTAGMDVRARHDFWDTMHAEADRGRTIVFATHFLPEAEDFADRIVLMREGGSTRTARPPSSPPAGPSPSRAAGPAAETIRTRPPASPPPWACRRTPSSSNHSTSPPAACACASPPGARSPVTTSPATC